MGNTLQAAIEMARTCRTHLTNTDMETVAWVKDKETVADGQARRVIRPAVDDQTVLLGAKESEASSHAMKGRGGKRPGQSEKVPSFTAALGEPLDGAQVT